MVGEADELHEEGGVKVNKKDVREVRIDIGDWEKSRFHYGCAWQ